MIVETEKRKNSQTNAECVEKVRKVPFLALLRFREGKTRPALYIDYYGGRCICGGVEVG